MFVQILLRCVDVISGQHDNVLVFLKSMASTDGEGNNSGENWNEVLCDDECLNNTESAAFSDVSAIRWTLSDCEDTEDAIMIADLQAVVCAKLSGMLRHLFLLVFCYFFYSIL